MTKKKFGLFTFIVTAVFAVIAFAVSAVSVSYAGWVPSQQMPCSLNIGEWGYKNYTLEFPDRTTEGEVNKFGFTPNDDGSYSVSFEANTNEKFVVKEDGVIVGFTLAASDAVTYDEATKSYTVIENAIITTLKRQPAPYSFKINGDNAAVTLHLTLTGDGGLTNQEIKDIIGGGTFSTGGVTSGGEKIEFDENGKATVELNAGDTFVLCMEGVVIDNGFFTLGGNTISLPEDGSITFDGKQFIVNKPGTYEITKQGFLFKRISVTEVPEETQP